jgi:hypothetical protein
VHTPTTEEGEMRMTERARDGEQPFTVEDAWIGGWDFTIVFDDAVVGGLDEEELEVLFVNLAAPEGITEVIHEDREVFHLKVENLDAPAVQEKATEAVKQVGLSFE